MGDERLIWATKHIWATTRGFYDFREIDMAFILWDLINVIRLRCYMTQNLELPFFVLSSINTKNQNKF